MRTLGTGNAAQIERRVSSAWVRLQVEDHLGVMQTHPPFEIEYEDPSANVPVGSLTARIRRGQGASSYAPLMTANPPVKLSRAVTLAIDAGGGSWTPVFSGTIDRTSTPEKDGDVTVEARDFMGALVDQTITVEREYGSTAGTALETVIQAVIDDNWHASYGTAPVLYVATPTGAVITDDLPYIPVDVSIFESIRYLAETIGAVVLPRYIEGVGWRIALVEPARAKTVPDHTFDPADYYDVSQLDQDKEDIFTLVEVEYSDGDGQRRRVQYPAAVDVDTDPAVVEHGLLYMRINLADDDPIRDGVTALALATAAHSDLSQPNAELEIQCAYFWPGEVGTDLYRFTANNRHFSSDQDLAAVAIKHRLAIDQRPESWVKTRGKPSAGVLLWRRRARRGEVAEPDRNYALNDVRFADEATGRRYYWSNGAGIEEIYAATATIAGDVTNADWAALEAAVTLQGLITEYLVPWPGEDNRTIGRIEGRWTTPSGTSGPEQTFVLKIDVPGTRPPISVTVEVSENAAGTQATYTATVEDPRGVVSGANIWILQNGAETGPTAMTAAGAGVYTHTVSLLPKPHITLARGELTRNDGGDPIPFSMPSADSDKAATVLDAQAAPGGTGDATITAVFDSDTAVGVGEAEYRIDGGTSTAVTVAADRTATWTVAQTSAEQLVEIRGRNAGAAWGAWFPLRVSPHTAPSSFARIASLTAALQQGGLCSSSLYIINRVTAEFEGAVTGDTWDLRRFVDGAEVAAVAVNQPVSTTQVDDTITGYQLSFGSSELSVTYRAELTPAAGGWDTRDSPALIQEHQACP